MKIWSLLAVVAIAQRKHTGLCIMSLNMMHTYDCLETEVSSSMVIICTKVVYFRKHGHILRGTCNHGNRLRRHVCWYISPSCHISYMKSKGIFGRLKDARMCERVMWSNDIQVCGQQVPVWPQLCSFQFRPKESFSCIFKHYIEESEREREWVPSSMASSSTEPWPGRALGMWNVSSWKDRHSSIVWLWDMINQSSFLTVQTSWKQRAVTWTFHTEYLLVKGIENIAVNIHWLSVGVESSVRLAIFLTSWIRYCFVWDILGV